MKSQVRFHCRSCDADRMAPVTAFEVFESAKHCWWTTRCTVCGELEGYRCNHRTAALLRTAAHTSKR